MPSDRYYTVRDFRVFEPWGIPNRRKGVLGRSREGRGDRKACLDRPRPNRFPPSNTTDATITTTTTTTTTTNKNNSNSNHDNNAANTLANSC